MRWLKLFLAGAAVTAMLAGCHLLDFDDRGSPTETATPSASPTASQDLPLPSIRDLGSPDPPATVQPIASP